MGDKRRFDLFSKYISEHLLKDMKIADVAGGKGYLQLALRERGFKDITSWDKRNFHLKNINYRFGYFDHNTKEKYDAVIAMHPDEGTDHALLYALNNNIPAIICPCCIKPSAAPYFGNYKYSFWLQHLKDIASKNNNCLIHDKIKISGRNDILHVY